MQTPVNQVLNTKTGNETSHYHQKERGNLMKILFLTNLPSPYRRMFFAELGKRCELTVIYERISARDRDVKWTAEKKNTYKEIFLNSRKLGDDNSFTLEIIKYLRTEEYDKYVVGMYGTYTAMIAITYMQIKHIPFYLSTDGGWITKESNIKYLIKKHFIGAASFWLSTGANSTDYLVHYGAKKDRVAIYPFTSLTEADVIKANSFTYIQKLKYREKLGMLEKQILLSVGRFTYESGYGKGYDILLKAAERLDKNIGIYIVGDEPTEEFIKWKEEKKLNNVHFTGFKGKKDLSLYYASADAFILLTRKEAWGLVINEAMSYSLPVITTNQCNAGLELVHNEKNGYLVEAGDVDATVKSITKIFENEIRLHEMGRESFKIINGYTIEKMVLEHMKIFNNTEL